jgi:peptide/nickel transport system permease protein
MTSYVIRRFIQTAVVLFVLSFLTYLLMGLMPGDPLDIACQANPQCTPDNLEEMKRNLGLDRPVYVRYLEWAGNVIQGDLGYSRTYQKPVTEILLPRLGNTLILGVIALIVSVLVALPLGIWASLRQGTRTDYVINFLAFIGISMPSFWLGLVLVIIFAVWLNWFPASGVETVGVEFASFWDVVIDRVQYLVLPVASLSAQTIASWIRFTRASMIETMRNDYIRTATAKGLARSEVVRMHGFRNALIPVVTVIAVSFSFLFSGAVITETVFSYQGIGKLMFDSIMGNDFNVAMCAFVISCFAVLMMNLLADICYAWLDPRISYK